MAEDERRSIRRTRLKVIHRHRIGSRTFRRVSELVFVRGKPRAMLEWVNLGGVRSPLYIAVLLRRAHGRSALRGRRRRVAALKRKGRDARSYESPGRARGRRRKREGASPSNGRVKFRLERLKCPLRGAARSSPCGRIGATEGGVISVVGEVVELSTPHLS